jgi:hypothetical protein
MKWFRLYNETLHDPKVQTLPAELFRSWINVMCIASSEPERGTLPGLRQVAFLLRVKEEKARQILASLNAFGLLDETEDGSLRPHNWEERQRNSDDVATRVRQSRKRKSDTTSNNDVTLPATGQETDAKPSCIDVARAPDSEEIREEQPPLPPSGGTAAAARFAPLPPGAEEAIAEARSRVSDDAAEIVRREASAIDRQLGGRFDLFVEALEAAQNRRPKLEVRHVYSWAMKRALGRLSDPPPARHVNGTVLSPAERATPAADPAKAASKHCEHCSGEGVVTVYHPAPDPARRIPATTPADCTCLWGRKIRAGRSAEDAARIPDLADVLARRCAWLADRP